VSFMGAYADLMFEPEANETAAEFVRGKIREIVRDPLVAEALMYETCLAIGTRESGNAQAIRNMADSAQRKLAKNGFDMRNLALTDAGLTPRSR